MSDIVPLLSGYRVREDLYPASMEAFMNIEGVECVPIVQNIQNPRWIEDNAWPFNFEQTKEFFHYLPLQDRAAFQATCKSFYDLGKLSVRAQLYEMRILTRNGFAEFNRLVDQLPDNQVLPIRALSFRVKEKLQLERIHQLMPQLQVLVFRAITRHFILDDLLRFIKKPGLKEIHIVNPYDDLNCFQRHNDTYGNYFELCCHVNPGMTRKNLLMLAREARRNGVSITAIEKRIVEMTLGWRMNECLYKALLVLLVLLFLNTCVFLNAEFLVETLDDETVYITYTWPDGDKISHTSYNERGKLAEMLNMVFEYSWEASYIAGPIVILYALIVRYSRFQKPRFEVIADV